VEPVYDYGTVHSVRRKSTHRGADRIFGRGRAGSNKLMVAAAATDQREPAPRATSPGIRPNSQFPQARITRVQADMLHRWRRVMREGAVPISPYLKGQAFVPETVRAMGIAFDKACRSLGLAARTDPATEAVAALVIEQAQAGEHDPDRICAAILERYKPHT